MSYRLPRYRVSLVREGSCVTENNAIRSPEDVFALINAESAESAVEIALLPGDQANSPGVFHLR